MVDDGRYALVVRHDLSDEDATALGYTFDGDEAVRTGRSLAVRTITVSDELGAKLSRGQFVNDEGETVASWPKSGGTPAAQTVDVPESNPSTRPIKLDDGTELTAAEADERAYQSAAIDEVLERAEIAAEEQAGTAHPDIDGAKQRVAQIDDRIEEIDKTVEAASDEGNSEVELTDAEFDELTDERKRLSEERAEITTALEERS